MADKIGGDTGDLVATLLTVLAALNWALIEFGSTDLLVDVAGLQSGTLTLVYALIGVAAAVTAYNELAWRGIIE